MHVFIKLKKYPDLRIGGSFDRVPKSSRYTKRSALLVSLIMAIDNISGRSGRNSSEFMNDASLVSDGPDKHTYTEDLCERMYISSNHGYVCGMPITISTPS